MVWEAEVLRKPSRAEGGLWKPKEGAGMWNLAGLMAESSWKPRTFEVLRKPRRRRRVFIETKQEGRAEFYGKLSRRERS